MAGYAAKLACFLIKDQLGEMIHSVCSCLISRGHLGLPEIASLTRLSRQQLSSCLLVLIQHNCVQAFKVHDEENLDAKIRYIAIVDHIILRSCFPLFLELINEKAGKEAEELALGLLQHGRLTLEQLMKRDAECGDSVQAQFKDAFMKLLKQRLVERCPRPEAVIGVEETTEARPAKKTRASAKKRPALSLVESQPRLVIAAACPMEAERFKSPSSWDMEEDVGTSTVSAGQKRKRDTLASSMSTMDETEVLWRVNFEECIRLLRHKACASHVNVSFGPDAKTVIEAMLEATRKSEKTAKESSSQPLTLNDILILRPDWTAPVVRTALKRMVEEGFVNSVGDAGCHYSVAMQKIVEMARRAEVESTVLQRFGKPASRIFRLLCKRGGAEHKLISEKCLIPGKETWQLLYQMMKEGYIELQEVPRSAGDRAPSRTFYLWHVNLHKVTTLVLENACHAAYNLHSQIEYRLEHEKEILIIPATGSLSSEQQQKLDRLQTIVKILEVSIFRLLGTILLYHFF